MPDDQRLIGRGMAPSFRSPSGKRMHPRVQLPAQVEIEGVHYRLGNWSLGGCAFEEEGPPAALGDPLRVRLHVGEGAVRFSVEAVAQVVRVSAGRMAALQFMSLPPDSARLLDRVVESAFTGDRTALAVLFTPPPAASRGPIPLPGALSRRRGLRNTAILAACTLFFLASLGFLLTRWLAVQSEFAAVAGALHVVRAPQGGIVTLPSFPPGTQLRAGQAVALLDPTVPPHVLTELEPRLRQAEARLAQLRQDLAQARAGFDGFRRRAQVNLQAATAARQLAERSLAAQERLHGRISGLARQGLASQVRVDQIEVEMFTQRRMVAEARAAEEMARQALADAEAGRFVTDGRSLQASPSQMAQEIEALEAQRAALQAMLANLSQRLALHAPCDCQIVQYGTSSGAFVSAGDALVALADHGGAEAREVDALVRVTRFGLLRLGQPVEVVLAGAEAPLPGRIVALNLNPDFSGRIGLPNHLRVLDRYGLVTIRLDAPAPAATSGLPAQVRAPIEINQLLRNLSSIFWLA